MPERKSSKSQAAIVPSSTGFGLRVSGLEHPCSGIRAHPALAWPLTMAKQSLPWAVGGWRTAAGVLDGAISEISGSLLDPLGTGNGASESPVSLVRPGHASTEASAGHERGGDSAALMARPRGVAAPATASHSLPWKVGGWAEACGARAGDPAGLALPASNADGPATSKGRAALGPGYSDDVVMGARGADSTKSLPWKRGAWAETL